jgi:hypothetical protein
MVKSMQRRKVPKLMRKKESKVPVRGSAHLSIPPVLLLCLLLLSSLNLSHFP